MPTQNQQRFFPRTKKHKKNLKNALVKSPHKSGVCLRTLIRNPKKPNSARRRVSYVRLCTNRKIYVHVPGEGHPPGIHASVLVRGGNCRDLPGIRYKVVRGARDMGPIIGRKTARSKYGVSAQKNN